MNGPERCSAPPSPQRGDATADSATAAQQVAEVGSDDSARASAPGIVACASATRRPKGRRASVDPRQALGPWLVGLAVDDTARVWAEFVDEAASLVEVRDGLLEADTVKRWRKVRPGVLAALEALGLHATVERIDLPGVDVADHEADLAGLVHVHRGYLDDRRHRPAAPSDATLDAYRARMLGEHGLVPDDGLPTELRGFLGQYSSPYSPEGTAHDPCVALRLLDPTAVGCSRAVGCSDLQTRYGQCVGVPRELAGTCGRWAHSFNPVRWLDHVHGWREADTRRPVLTAEPYAFDPGATYADLVDLPLNVETLPGVWSPGSTTLFVLRWAHGREPLPAVHVRKRAANPRRGDTWTAAS